MRMYKWLLEKKVRFERVCGNALSVKRARKNTVGIRFRYEFSLQYEYLKRFNCRISYILFSTCKSVPESCMSVCVAGSKPFVTELYRVEGGGFRVPICKH
jgi:hypothetical protein